MSSVPKAKDWSELTHIGRQYVIVNSITPALAILAVVLRLVSKRIAKQRLGGDDYTILVCLIFALGLSGEGIYYALTNKVGVPLRDHSGEEIQKRIRVHCVQYSVGHFLFGLVKVSILLFYKKMFPISKFRIAANILLGIVIVWMAAALGLSIPTFKQIERLWVILPLLKEQSDIQLPKSPLVRNFLTGNLIINISLDVIILAMPLPVIGMLKLPRYKKLLLLIIFFLGFFCTVASVVRLKYTLLTLNTHPSYPLWANYVDYQLMWGQVEVGTSLVAACSPFLGTLFKRAPICRQLLRKLSEAYANKFPIEEEDDEPKPSLFRTPDYGPRDTPTPV